MSVVAWEESVLVVRQASKRMRYTVGLPPPCRGVVMVDMFQCFLLSYWFTNDPVAKERCENDGSLLLGSRLDVFIARFGFDPLSCFGWSEWFERHHWYAMKDSQSQYQSLQQWDTT